MEIINTQNEIKVTQLFYLAKQAGLTLKQLDPSILNISGRRLKYEWSQHPASRAKNRQVVHKRHKAKIIELIIHGINIFEVSWIYNYHPQTVLRFLEQQTINPEWELKNCLICKIKFVSFQNKLICSEEVCKKQKKQNYDKIRWRTSKHNSSY